MILKHAVGKTFPIRVLHHVPCARSHNDTYAESFHRDFFANWAKGVPPERCALGTEGHNTAQIGGFVVGAL